MKSQTRFFVALVTAGFTFCAGSQRCVAVDFGAAMKYTVGANPRAVSVGDFNGDGIMDLVVADSGTLAPGDDGSVSVLLGNGDGTFRAAVNYSAGKIPVAVATGDFNGDGKLDLVVANSGSSNISVLLGKGDGTFQTHVDSEIGAGLTGLAVGDFNGDKKLDLVVSHGPGGVSVLLGNGDGSFQVPVTYSADASAESVAVADFNSDGKLDIAVAGKFNSGIVAILEGNGDGTFQPAQAYDPAGLIGGALAVGDFNGDGKLDLVVGVVSLGNASKSHVDLLLGRGDGTFSSGISLDSGGCRAGSPFAADLNGDGMLDLALVAGGGSPDGICVFSGGTISILAGNGDGTFQPPAILSSANATNLGAATDLGGSRSPDLVTLNNDSTISVILNSVDEDRMLTVSVAGTGSGVVTSNSGGISCGSAQGSCKAAFLPGTHVSLTAVPANNAAFTGWSGACIGTDPNSCSVTMSADAFITATFTSADFALNPSTQNLAVKRGAQGSETLMIMAQGGFSGSIALKCSVSGPAPMPTCGITPSSVTAGNTATLTVNASGLSAALVPQSFERVGGLYAAWLPLGLVGCILTAGFDKKRRRLWLLILAMVVTILPAACGGGSGQPPSQSYTVTVAATSGAIQHSTNINVTVN